MMRTLAPLALATLLGCAGQAVSTDGSGGDHLTSIGGTPQQIDWDGFVYVDPSADVPTIQQVIARQVKSSLGSLREVSIGIEDRAALHNLDPAGWTRDTLNVVDGSGAVVRQLVRVRYHYTDTALVGNGNGLRGAFNFVVLVGDFTQATASAALQPACVDEATDGDSLWYHFQPGQSACAQLIQQESAAIAADQAKLHDASQIALSDANRRFQTIRAKLTAPAAATPVKYPEYDRLWGFGTDRQKVVVYAFVGVTANEQDSHDEGAIEYQRLLRTLRQKFPKLACTYTNPFGMLLDFYVDGQKLPNVSWDDVANWMIDGTGYPAAVGSDPAKIENLRQQVIANFSERWIYWDLPVTVSNGRETRSMTVELRTFWGNEDGRDDWKQHAIWRYLEAFWYGDVFAYAGHSHFGHGPLEPTNYQSWNFPDRYQVMLVNSCLSYNYYDLDFIAMHPEQSRDLEVVMNGLPAYWEGMGQSTADYLIALLDGTGKSWSDVLSAMKIDLSWGVSGYEPMRGVNGELDNVYDPKSTPLTVAY